MASYNDLNNYTYYKITKKSGCISMGYNFKDDNDQRLIIVDNVNEISGNYHTNK